MNFFTHLKCSSCDLTYPGKKPINLCECGSPLLAQYDLKAAQILDKTILKNTYQSIWDLFSLLPIQQDRNRLYLGEGNTPLIKGEKIGKQLGIKNIYIKDEASNPTGSFKARGLCIAVSKAKELAIKVLSIPTAGNAGGALSAYAALAGMEAHIAMPKDTPQPFIDECLLFGGNVILIDGIITDCGAYLKEAGKGKGWFDVSTLKEPYRIEGKKTMGYELAFQFDWNLPDVIIYPTGGGTGLIGMWKAFSEMEELGWIGSQMPKMVVVQSEGCAPMVRAFNEKRTKAIEWEYPDTFAMGLRVPKAIGDSLILKAVNETGGTAIAVSEKNIKKSLKQLASLEGILACPEGAATLAAAEKLRSNGWIKPSDHVVLFNTGSIYKYLDLIRDFYD